MHTDEVATDAPLERSLLATQFPQWAELAIALVDSYGTDHDIYRLGDHLAARLPRIGWATKQAAKEREWLPKLAPHLPLASPCNSRWATPQRATRSTDLSTSGSPATTPAAASTAKATSSAPHAISPTSSSRSAGSTLPARTFALVTLEEARSRSTTPRSATQSQSSAIASTRARGRTTVGRRRGLGARRPAPRQSARRRRMPLGSHRLRRAERRRRRVRSATGMERLHRQQSSDVPHCARGRRGVVATRPRLGARPSRDGAALLLGHRSRRRPPGEPCRDRGSATTTGLGAHQSIDHEVTQRTRCRVVRRVVRRLARPARPEQHRVATRGQRQRETARPAEHACDVGVVVDTGSHHHLSCLLVGQQVERESHGDVLPTVGSPLQFVSATAGDDDTTFAGERRAQPAAQFGQQRSGVLGAVDQQQAATPRAAAARASARTSASSGAEVPSRTTVW